MKKILLNMIFLLSACSAISNAPTPSTISLQKLYFTSGGSDLCMTARNGSGQLLYTKEKCIEYVRNMVRSSAYQDYTKDVIPLDDVLFYAGAAALCRSFLPTTYTEDQCNKVVEEMKAKNRYAPYKRDLDIQMTRNPSPTFTPIP